MRVCTEILAQTVVLVRRRYELTEHTGSDPL